MRLTYRLAAEMVGKLFPLLLWYTDEAKKSYIIVIFSVYCLDGLTGCIMECFRNDRT